MASEFEAARTVQQLLVTSEVEGVEAVYRPASEVGGDFYQVLPLDDGSFLVAVGDVSGKGLKAAMIVSMMIALLRTHRQLSPGPLLERINRELADRLQGGFVTCIAARIDSAGNAVIANAGHPAPFSDGTELALESGLPLGIVETEYLECHRTIRSFTLYSDGVLEAADAKGELFGFERTAAISGKSANEIAEAARAWGQNDDITVVTVRRGA
jgi:serine phosphatase RsbU (regulator of sigma subunit)